MRSTVSISTISATIISATAGDRRTSPSWKSGADVDHLKELINETFYTGAMDQVTIFKALADGDKDVMKFAQMRRDNVVNFATRLTEAVRAVNPDLIISAALMPEGAYSGDYNVSGMDSVSFADLHYGQNYKGRRRSLRLHRSHGI